MLLFMDNVFLHRIFFPSVQPLMPPASFRASFCGRGSKGLQCRDGFENEGLRWVGPFSTFQIEEGENCSRDPNGMHRLDTDPNGLDEQQV